AANTYAYNTDNGATLGTVPTMTTAFASHISPAGDSWLLDGNLGLGRVPEVDLDVYGAIRAGDPGLGPNTNGALVIGTSTNGGRIVWSTDGDGYIYNDYGPTVVLGSDSNTQFAFRVNGQASTNRFTVRADGNVGIGTAQPADRLHVRGNAIIEHQGVGLVLQRAGYDEWLLGQIATGFAIHNSTDNRNDIVIDGSGNVGIGTANPVASLEVNGGIRSSGGSPGIGGTANNGYAFSGNGGDNDSGMFSSADAQLEFYTDNVERARFNYGNFGIGTTTPAAPLDVHVATNTDAIVATRDDVNPPRLELGFETVSGFPTIQATRGGGPWDLLLNPLVGGGGAVGINTTTPGAALQVGSPGDGSQALANAWNTFSDGRFKTHVAPLTNALDLLTAIDGVQFTWAESGSPSIGFIAQDVEAVLPQIVTTDANGYKSLDYARLTPLLVEALKDQQDDIGALRLENTQLHETNTRLQTEIAAIRAQVAGASPAAAAWRWLDALQTCALLAGAAFFFWSRRAQKNVRK
ncbi:MAG: tail fiber domain-containing protein, partial [Anaerolineales bacterium]|nr:tail fiber domain-containing protein [Anaerolineales bacterium]